MSGSWLNPGRWLAVAAVLGALWGAHWWDKRQAVAIVHAEYKGRAEVAAEGRKIEERVREERARKADHAYRQQLDRSRTAAARLRAEHDSLQQLLADRAAAREAAGDTGRADAATTGEELFGACSREYADLAGEAAKVQSDLRGLQGWVTASCGN